MGTLRTVLLGPFSRPTWGSKVTWLTIVGILTLTTQIGGLVLWPILGLATTLPERRRLLGGIGLFAASYLVAALVVVPLVARPFGRVPLPCFGDGSIGPRSLLFCAANRHYVVPEMRAELIAVSDRVAEAHPGTRVAFLDAGFPFPGVPLLPHLSHGDGRKADLALVLAGGGSPVGYFGYIQPSGPSACPPRGLDLRWDLAFLQPLFGPPRLDEARTRSLVESLVARPAIQKLFIEPHLRDRLGLTSPKIRFQGCHAARHDDHIHVQL